MTTVFLNPGHSNQYEIDKGYGEPGACANGLRENDIAASVTDYIASYLEEYGVNVVGVMQSDDLEAVVDAANNAGADLFVSIHCNAAGSESAEGTESFYCEDEYEDRELAKCINARIIDIIGTEDRGVKPDTDAAVGSLYVLRRTNMPAALVELAFITNVEEALLLRYKQKDFGEAIALGILDYAGYEQDKTETTQDQDTDIEGIAILARKYESNGDPSAVSTGEGDLGGISYGLYQLSSAVGAVDEFVEWLCEYPDDALANYGRVLAEHEVNSDEFIGQWQELGRIDPGGFSRLQDEYIKTRYYDRAAYLLKHEGYNEYKHTAAMRAVIFARSIQNGPAGCLDLMLHAVDIVSNGRNWNLSYVDAPYFDEMMITAVYEFLINECDMSVPDGDDVWHSTEGFCNGSKGTIFGLRARFIREKEDALALLRGEGL